MQKRKSIVNIPLLAGIMLSIAVHAAALYSRGIYTPAKPRLEAGRTVVQLTLVPIKAAKATEQEPIIEPPEPAIKPVPVIAPAPVPEPSAKSAHAESAEQIASIIEDKGVEIQASPVSGIRATYPRSSQRRGHQGTVVLSIQVLSSGIAGEVTVVSSSGFQRLDDAAIEAARIAEYIPAKQFGQNVESELIQPVTFELTE